MSNQLETWGWRLHPGCWQQHLISSEEVHGIPQASAPRRQEGCGNSSPNSVGCYIGECTYVFLRNGMSLHMSTAKKNWQGQMNGR